MNNCVEQEECTVGCGCPDGMVRDDNDECVVEADCPCYSENGVVIHENFTVPSDKPCEEW